MNEETSKHLENHLLNAAEVWASLAENGPVDRMSTSVAQEERKPLHLASARNEKAIQNETRCDAH
jgi:hypothetical protein